MSGAVAFSVSPTIPGRIHRAGFGWINVGGTTFEHDRVLHPGGVSPVWWRKRRHYFDWDDAAAILDAHPGISELILGTGWMGMMRVDKEEIERRMQAQDMKFIVLKTPEAIGYYQQSWHNGIVTVAALHVTC